MSERAYDLLDAFYKAAYELQAHLAMTSGLEPDISITMPRRAFDVLCDQVGQSQRMRPKEWPGEQAIVFNGGPAAFKIRGR